MLESLKVKYFRGIKEIEIPDFKQFNLIVGSNNAGKSSILETLFMSCTPVDLGAAIRPNFLRNYRTFGRKFCQSYFWQMDINKKISIEVNYLKPKHKRVIEFSSTKLSKITPSKVDDNPLKSINSSQLTSTNEPDPFEALKIETTITRDKEYYIAQTLTFSDPPKDEPPPEEGKIHAYFTLKQEVRGFDEGEELNLEPSRSTFITARLLEEPKELAARFDKLETAKKTDRLLKALKKIQPSLKGISYTANYEFWCDLGLQNSLVPMYVMGDGFNRIFQIVLAISNSEDGLVFIDEIENGLYYSTMETLWTTIFNVAREFNVQIFATTHSLDCLQRFVKCDTTKKDDTRLYRIENNKGKLQAVKYNEKNLATSIQSGWEVR
jgi:AAA15 family ATPase/GTPase